MLHSILKKSWYWKWWITVIGPKNVNTEWCPCVRLFLHCPWRDQQIKQFPLQKFNSWWMKNSTWNGSKHKVLLLELIIVSLLVHCVFMLLNDYVCKNSQNDAFRMTQSITLVIWKKVITCMCRQHIVLHITYIIVHWESYSFWNLQ